MDHRRSTSEQAPARSITDSIAATVLEAEFQRTKEELAKSRLETSRVACAYERTKERLELERSTSVARAAERDQPVSMAKSVAGYATEATQTIEALQRRSSTQVAQSQHLKDHVRLAERHIDKVGTERQQYATENARLRAKILSMEKRIREVEGIVDNLRHDSQLPHSKIVTAEQDFNAATFWTQELETKLTLLEDRNIS